MLVFWRALQVLRGEELVGDVNADLPEVDVDEDGAGYFPFEAVEGQFLDVLDFEAKVAREIEDGFISFFVDNILNEDLVCPSVRRLLLLVFRVFVFGFIIHFD